MEKLTVQTEFMTDTAEGLSSRPKYLLSKYFYDDKGSNIFQDIMQMPEYYLTDCEQEILSLYKDEITNHFNNGSSPFDLIELGAGDGSKTKTILKHMVSQSVKFNYQPFDISKLTNNELEQSLNNELPELPVFPKTGDFFQLLKKQNGHAAIRKVILFLGSNIGNFSDDELHLFFTRLKEFTSPGDKLFIGFDLKKSPKIIRKAYDDPHGHTRKFNLNLLHRLNNELGADFNIDKFEQHTEYDPASGEVKSYLISMEEQVVYIKALKEQYELKQWEPIFMELSRKFDAESLENLAKEYDFIVEQNFTDLRNFFVDSLWIRK
ncbi:L-histidine N(alpha)-methyltransferase [Draconibacterium halophilum]|uniref:L-histidine N(Alpha)-methyltransferase n=1 Tax=Draconibacterium halophilum TaxID=2706887 RepID=A0A6C0RE71_9BACT|nr:L-histidine N(alpha)-methyltransferase [Draconibacterium halophilum]QIA08978.1 L-histidine N(alpha)-methyltransferase [Draconibacterium halophilum]